MSRRDLEEDRPRIRLDTTHNYFGYGGDRIGGADTALNALQTYGQNAVPIATGVTAVAALGAYGARKTYTWAQDMYGNWVKEEEKTDMDTAEDALSGKRARDEEDVAAMEIINRRNTYPRGHFLQHTPLKNTGRMKGVETASTEKRRKASIRQSSYQRAITHRLRVKATKDYVPLRWDSTIGYTRNPYQAGWPRRRKYKLQKRALTRMYRVRRKRRRINY